jgi:hypothetical protein
MDTRAKVPDYVTVEKVFEWTMKTPFNEGVMSIHNIYEIASKVGLNWLLVYSWCYVRTEGFRHECMKRWDYGNLGGNYATSRDGVQEAVVEFLKFHDTSLLEQERETLDIYEACRAFCASYEHDKPKPLPEPPKPPPPPPPPPPPKPEPEPTPEPTPTPTPGKLGLWWIPIIIGALSIGSLFVPGWAKIIIDVIIKVLEGL